MPIHDEHLPHQFGRRNFREVAGHGGIVERGELELAGEIEPSQELLDALAARIGVDRILITRLDEAPSLGAQVALSISSRLPISYLASGDTVGFGLAPADPVMLASMVLP